MLASLFLIEKLILIWTLKAFSSVLVICISHMWTWVDGPGKLTVIWVYMDMDGTFRVTSLYLLFIWDKHTTDNWFTHLSFKRLVTAKEPAPDLSRLCLSLTSCLIGQAVIVTLIQDVEHVPKIGFSTLSLGGHSSGSRAGHLPMGGLVVVWPLASPVCMPKYPWARSRGSSSK